MGRSAAPVPQSEVPISRPVEGAALASLSGPPWELQWHLAAGSGPAAEDRGNKRRGEESRMALLPPCSVSGLFTAAAAALSFCTCRLSNQGATMQMY